MITCTNFLCVCVCVCVCVCLLHDCIPTCQESGEMAGAREEEPLVADASCVDAKGKERERRVNRDRDRERDRDGGTSDNVKVSVRCRPMVEKEQREGHRGVVRVDRLRREVTVQLPSPAQQRVFTYDVVFGPESTQAEVFNETARPIVDSVLQGYNGMVAYKTTGGHWPFPAHFSKMADQNIEQDTHSNIQMANQV